MAKWFPEPSTRDDTYARSCEETLYWLKRSTLPLAVDYRDFLNRNLSMLPKSCREGIYNHLRNERHYQDGFFELIVGRTLQEMGASIECEPATISGVLGFAEVGVLRCADPILWQHPRFGGRLPQPLNDLEITRMPGTEP